MNRELKFRAWDKEYLYMYKNAYPFEHLVYVEMDINDPDVQAMKHKMMEVNGKWFYWILAKDIELMQYTELKDKNEREIFECDICQIDGQIHEVYWNEDRWGLQEVTSRQGSYFRMDYDNGDYYQPNEIDWHECEVIGNIWENSNLLETSQG